MAEDFLSLGALLQEHYINARYKKRRGALVSFRPRLALPWSGAGAADHLHALLGPGLEPPRSGLPADALSRPRPWLRIIYRRPLPCCSTLQKLATRNEGPPPRFARTSPRASSLWPSCWCPQPASGMAEDFVSLSALLSSRSIVEKLSTRNDRVLSFLVEVYAWASWFVPSHTV